MPLRFILAFVPRRSAAQLALSFPLTFIVFALIQPGWMQSANLRRTHQRCRCVSRESLSFALVPFLSSRMGAAAALSLTLLPRLPGDRRGNTFQLTNSINRKGEKPERRRASGGEALSSRIRHCCSVFATQGRRAVFVSTFYYVRCLPCPRRKRAAACIVERRNPQNPRALPPTINSRPNFTDAPPCSERACLLCYILVLCLTLFCLE